MTVTIDERFVKRMYAAARKRLWGHDLAYGEREFDEWLRKTLAKAWEDGYVRAETDRLCAMPHARNPYAETE